MAESLKTLNQPLTPARAAVVLVALAAMVGVGFGGRALWQKWSARPKSSASVQDSVRDYLKEHASPKDCNSDYDFNLRASVTAAETNFAKAREEVGVMRTNIAQLRAEMNKLKGDALTAKQAELKALRDKSTELESNLQTARREFNQKQQMLANQHQSFAREVKTNILQAGSYEAIYTWIGRTLWTADRLLASSEFSDQRSGAMLAEDAANYAIHNAENNWLAARICEGWVWPCLEKYDAPGKPKVALNQVLQTCADAFNRAGETNNLLKNFGLRLKYASSPRAADNVRYYMANALEQSGNFTEALENYRAIQETNLLVYTQRRIAALEKRLAK